MQSFTDADALRVETELTETVLHAEFHRRRCASREDKIILLKDVAVTFIARKSIILRY